MKPVFKNLIDGVLFSGDLKKDIVLFLTHHGLPKTAAHCLQVGAKARELALRFSVDPEAAEQAGWLHDVSAVISKENRAAVAKRWGLEVLPEEEAYPMIVHQKLSAVISRESFGVTEEDILSAVGCHTTLKANASLLDKVVFVADKIAWDQEGEPPYLEPLLAALETSVDAGALVYLSYLWQQRDQLKVVHPWFKDAYLELSNSGG
jgi:predicted HD superfamily hydrolase involved in NAD metabolism